MSSEDASECLNMESADFAHQVKEGLWHQKSLQSLYPHWLEGEKAPWAVSNTSAPPTACCDLAFIATMAVLTTQPRWQCSSSAMAFLGISAEPAFAQIKGIKPMGLGQALL